MPNGNLRNVTEDRLADLEMLAEYFEDQAWSERWPSKIIFALARLKYPERGPFTIKHGDMVLSEAEWSERSYAFEMFYMRDVRDKDGESLLKK